MSSSGGNPLNNAGNGLKDMLSKWQNDPVGEFGSTAVDLSSGGLVKYDPVSGKGSEGFTLHHTDEWIGELSGRNKTRAENYQKQKDIDQAAAAQKQNFLNTQLQAYRTDVAASQAAQGVRQTAAARSNSVGSGAGVSGPGLGGMTNDMLGV